MQLRTVLPTLTLVALLASTTQAAHVTVTLENPPPTGTVELILFDSPNAFGDIRDPVRVERYALDGRPTYTMNQVPAGEYALVVHYDENDNGSIDRNFIGIPREPLGYANGYQPKGPPSYQRAAFVVDENQVRHFDITLRRPLGERGRWGVGIGLITQSSPYRDYDGNVSQLIPALSYNGSRLQIFGPNVQLGLLGSGDVRLAARGRYRIGAYEEDESDFLQGMGDRDDTFLLGPALQLEVPGGLDLSFSYEHDVLDRIGGGVGRLAIDKSFQAGAFRFSPEVGVNWSSSEIANHDFGVPMEKATASRPAYDVSDTLSPELGLGVLVEITPSWLLILNASVEVLDDEVTDSPLVSEDYVYRGFGALAYMLGK